MAVATFDSTIHFYTLRATQTQPQMLVVPDIGDPYAPPAASIICNGKASRHVVCYVAAIRLCAVSAGAPYVPLSYGSGSHIALPPARAEMTLMRRLQVDGLLESIPKMFASTQVADSCAGAAIQAAVEALQV